MSRLYIKDSRGRRPLPPPRIANRIKEYSDETYEEPSSGRQKSARQLSKYAASVQHARGRLRSPNSSGTSASEKDDADDASDEQSESDADEDNEQPAVFAPSHHAFGGEPGPKFRQNLIDNVSLAGSVESMFGEIDDYYNMDDDPNLSPEENMRRFEEKVFANTDDDDSYQGVDDISDSDDDDTEQYEEQQLFASLSEEDTEEQEFYLNQIDGLSAYGFGDESDATAQFPPSSRGSEVAPEPSNGRHVHFDIDSSRTFPAPSSQSPTISRALLPSALPEYQGVYGGPASAPASAQPSVEASSEASYDSDATDDDLPEAAVLQAATQSGQDQPSNATPRSPTQSPIPRSAAKAAPRMGPPRGIFIDEGTKASGILDPSGKLMLITHPHLLGEEFARRYGSSATSSPDVGFEELIEGSDIGDSPELLQLASTVGTDIMIASLNAAINDPNNSGQATGPQEAFYPAASLVLADYAADGDDLDAVFTTEDLGEDVINMDDVIKFDDDDSDDSDDPTSPIYMPPKGKGGLGGLDTSFAHLTNENVTAFRRNANPSYTSLSETPSFTPNFEFSTPARPSRKRKVNESPYTSSHYNGVTPVQRVRDPSHSRPTTPDSAPRSKRPRLMTA